MSRKRYDHVLSYLLTNAWALDAQARRVFASVIAARLAGHGPDPQQLADARAAQREPLPQPKRGGGLAIVPVHGPLVPRADAFSDISGMTSYDEIEAQLRAAMADPAVATIWLDIDSPGGSVAGATELAGFIREARATKPIVAHGRYLMASAAYWLAASATKVYLSPSGQAGSIGVYTMFDDITAALEQLGVKRTYIAAGEHKLEGNDAGPLTDEAHAHLKALVDAAYEDFIGDVARGRGVSKAQVLSGYGQGRVLRAAAALDAGLIDQVLTSSELFDRLQPSSAVSATAARAAADIPQDRTGDTGQDRAVVDLWQARTEEALLALSVP